MLFNLHPEKLFPVETTGKATWWKIFEQLKRANREMKVIFSGTSKKFRFALLQQIGINENFHNKNFLEWKVLRLACWLDENRMGSFEIMGNSTTFLLELNTSWKRSFGNAKGKMDLFNEHSYYFSQCLHCSNYQISIVTKNC